MKSTIAAIIASIDSQLNYQWNALSAPLTTAHNSLIQDSLKSLSTLASLLQAAGATSPSDPSLFVASNGRLGYGGRHIRSVAVVGEDVREKT